MTETLELEKALHLALGRRDFADAARKAAQEALAEQLAEIERLKEALRNSHKSHALEMARRVRWLDDSEAEVSRLKKRVNQLIRKGKP